jgi:hypothetical protein
MESSHNQKCKNDAIPINQLTSYLYLQDTSLPPSLKAAYSHFPLVIKQQYSDECF